MFLKHIVLYKMLLLVLILGVSVLGFFGILFSWKEVLIFQIISGTVFVFLSCFEFTNTSYRAQLPVQRYFYMPYSFIMFGVLKAAVFLSLGIMLYVSGTKVVYLFPVCIIIAVTELLVLTLRYYRKLCFVSIYANYVLISANGMYKIFASEIERVEFRYDVFYIIRKNGKTSDIRLIHIEETNHFIAHFISWIEKNHLKVGEESKRLLAAKAEEISRVN